MTYPAHSTPTAVLALLLAGCVTGCAGATLPKSSPGGSLSRHAAGPGSAMPPDPACESRLRWHASVPAPQGAGKLTWASASAPALCRAAVNIGPVTRVENEADFEALFCRHSDVDWQRLQLFVYRLAPMAPRALLTEDVVLNDSQINWLLVPEPCPEGSGPSARPAILIARNDFPVVARLKSGVSVDCPATGDGYGY